MSGLTDEEVGRFQQLHQLNCAHAYEIWNILTNTHQITGSVVAMGSLHNFLARQADEDVDITEHLKQMKSTRVQLESLGQEITEQDFKTQIVLSLPLTWEQYAESSFAPDGKVNNINITSHQLIIMHIQNEYNRWTGWRKDAEKGETSYQASSKSLMKRISDTTLTECMSKCPRIPCSICKCTNHREANCFFKPGAPQCNYCNKPGHLEKDCWSKSGGKGKKPSKGHIRPKKETAHIAVEESSGIEEVNVTYDTSRNNSETPSSYHWHADSTATCHVTSDFEALWDYIPNIETIQSIGGIEIQSHGHGTVKLRSIINKRSYKITLSRVCFIPLQWNSLLSLRQLDSQGGSVFIGNSWILIYDQHGMTVATGRVKRNQYQLDVKTIYPEHVHITQEQLSWDQWHTCYGHISFSSLQKTMNLVNNFIVDMNTVPSDCSACAKAKLSCMSHPKTS